MFELKKNAVNMVTMKWYMDNLKDKIIMTEKETQLLPNYTEQDLEKVINDIMSRNTVVTCIAIQKPNRKAIFAYNPNTDTEPWLALGDVDRPVSIANIKIYEYDETTNRYKRRIPIEISNFNKEFNEKIKKDNYNENLFFK